MKQFLFLLLCLLLCLLLPLACSRPQSFAPQSFPERPYALWVPDEASPKPFALVVLLHAYDTSPATQERFFRIKAELQKAGIAYAWPLGTKNLSGKRYWDANTSCCNHDAQHPEDLAYIMAVLEDVAQRLPIDSTRISLIGLSNGAFLAYQLACENPERFSKLIAVAGAPPASCPSLSASGPSILHIHGDADEWVPLEGGKLSPTATAFPSPSTMLELWATQAQCLPINAESPPPLFQQPFSQKAWICPQQKRHLTLWVIEGGKHQLKPTRTFHKAILHFLFSP
ncbi:MAG: hypothetical protein FWG75_02365 [Cystobacterineae bacterium]|nr:hypothetical protein [Cystobacterineae bacterium]